MGEWHGRVAPRLGRRLAIALGLAALAIGGIAGGTVLRSAAAASATAPDATATRATRADLDLARRRAARLESEVALAATRRPYLVLDLEQKMLRYRLMGMTMHEVPIPTLQIHGLLPSDGGTAAPPALAGIVSLKEKEGDPRLTPLSPEQVEAGAGDENVANVMPPEVPKEYRLTFNQKVAVRVAGEEEARGVSKVGAWWRSATARLRGHGKGEALLKIRLELEPAVAVEVYRSLLPDQRWLVLPPPGYRLPEVGQEPPPKPKSSRPQPSPTRRPKQPDAERGVPFAIPPPVDPSAAHGNGGGPPRPVEGEPRPGEPRPDEQFPDDPNQHRPPAPPPGDSPPGDAPPADPPDAEPPREPPRPPDAERLPDGGT